MRLDQILRAVVFLIVSVTAVQLLAAEAPSQLSPEGPEPPAFHEFAQLLQQYLKLRKTLPGQRNTKHRQEIVDRRRALAQAIRDSRKDAKQGDIFTPEVSEQFVRVIRDTLKGSSASDIRKTIRQGAPVTGFQPTVNGAYPEDLPVTTVPPTLLRRLPQLPQRLGYRIVGHDFVLQDTEARLILDFIPGALP